MIKVKNTIQLYDLSTMDAEAVIYINSHHYDDKKINLVINGTTYTVLAQDVISAVKNATNTKFY